MKPEIWSCGRVPGLWLGEWSDPVDLLLAEHHHQRATLTRIGRMIERQLGDVATMQTIVGPLADEAVLHRADEEEGLFPLLSRRKRREDGMDDLLKRLLEDHVQITTVAASAALSLGAIEDGTAPLPDRLRAELLHLIFLVESHLALENGLVLPIAHQRLTLLDRRAIEQDFRLRRGMVILPATGMCTASPTVSALTH
jgi:hemerythrin-like domain-containing protein